MLLCVYFPPDSPDYVFLEFISTVQRLVHHHPEYDIIIAGDFNLPDVGLVYHRCIIIGFLSVL